MDNIKLRMDELIDIINEASIKYYVDDNPSITDQEYDDYYNELLKLEEKYPDLLILINAFLAQLSLFSYSLNASSFLLQYDLKSNRPINQSFLNISLVSPFSVYTILYFFVNVINSVNIF